MSKRSKTKPKSLLCLLILILGLASISIIEVVPRTAFDANSEECTAVIVTGSAAKDGRAVLMKNRDTSDTENRPIYSPPTQGKYGNIMVETYWMGINEKGLAIMNTKVSVLGFGGSGKDNGALNRWIVEHCETVDEVCFELNNTAGEIGPRKRSGGTCIGVIDRFGKGAFIEVSGIGAYARFIVNGYDSQANHPRFYPGYASGPSGRDKYALDIMDRIFTEKGVISWEDVAQNVSRYVRDKEKAVSCFSISGEITNTITQAAMVAVSGNPRYDGKLNCMWGEYGNPPMVGLFVPSIPYVGQPPSILNSFWNYVWEKRTYAQGSCGSYYSPERVREIQSYTFFAEDYTFWKYDELLNSLPNGLTNTELKTRLQNYVSSSIQVATQIYLEEPQVLYYTIQHNQKLTITVISNSSINSFQFSANPNIKITFEVTGPSSTSGFCFILIPKKLCDGSLNVTLGNNNYIIHNPPIFQESSLLEFTYTNPKQVSITGPRPPDWGTFPLWDLNQDGVVNIQDLVVITEAYGSTPTEPNWNPTADLNSDGIVDVLDLIIVTIHYGEDYT